MHIQGNAPIDAYLAGSTVKSLQTTTGASESAVRAKPKAVPPKTLPPKQLPPKKIEIENKSDLLPVCEKPLPHIMSADPQEVLAGITRAWGTADRAYDFTRDGVVDVHDLLHYIKQLDAATPDLELSLAVPAASDEIEGQPGAMFATAHAPSPQVADLTTAVPAPGTPAIEAMVADSAPSTAATENLPAQPETSDVAARLRERFAQRDVSAHGVARANSAAVLAKLTDAFANRLAASGFAHQPPANLHELVEQFNLSPKQQQHMMQRLSARYPAGLGVNLQA